MSLEESVRREIEELHEVFEAWLAGTEGASLDPAETALVEGFRLISPEGRLLERRLLLEGLSRAHGNMGAEFRIEVRAVSTVALGDRLVLATYEEWQQRGDDERLGRQSSALLRQRPGGGFDWLHVHETWLPKEKAEA